MIIKKLHLNNFGKFQDKEIHLKEGFNVIYGENESGKSTIHTFLQGMFFGIKRLRGRASKTDTYTKYSPWKNSGWYEGSITFSCGDKSFRLERNFQKSEEDAVLFCESDGELLSVKDGDLAMLLGNISETVYSNTISIGQAKSTTEEGIYKELRDYLAKFQGSGDMRFNPEKALTLLKEKKKQLEKKESEIVKLQEQEAENIQYKIQYEESEIKNIRDKISNMTDTSMRGKEEKIESKEIRHLKQQRISRVIFGICSFLFMVLVLLQKIPWYVLVVIIGMFILVEFYFYNHQKKEEEDIDEDRIKIEERKRILIESLQEHRQKLENLQEDYQELRGHTEEFFAVRKDIKNVIEAMKRLSQTASKMQNMTGRILQKKMSEILSSLTQGKYSKVILDQDFTIHLDTGDKCVDLYQVSYGTVEQVYLSLRLACGEILCGQEELPLVFDEAFAMYDDKRLSETLTWVQQHYSQILIFSCNKREITVLDKFNIPYNLVMLEK